MRELSAAIKKVLSQDYMEVHDLVEITLPEFRYFVGDQEITLPKKTLYLAGLEIEINGQPYQNSLREIGQIRYTLSNAPDGCSVTVENMTKTFGRYLTSERKLDNARVTVKRAFLTDDGWWEIDTIFRDGYVRDSKVNGEVVTLNVVHEMSRKNATVANFPVTQRCYWIFRKEGCMWDPSQPGDPSYCSKERDTEEGCKGHGNLPQFGATGHFTIMESGSGYDPYPNNFPGGGVGGGGVGHWCVQPHTKIYLLREGGIKSWLPAHKVQKDDVLLSIDTFGQVIRTRVNEVINGETTQLMSIRTKDFSLTCTPSHPIITALGDDKGTPAAELQVGDEILVYDVNDISAKLQVIESLERWGVPEKVITFNLEESHTFVGSNQRNGGIVSHNLKADLDSGFGYRSYDQAYNLAQ
jgi:hypothetical protein